MKMREVSGSQGGECKGDCILRRAVLQKLADFSQANFSIIAMKMEPVSTSETSEKSLLDGVYDDIPASGGNPTFSRPSPCEQHSPAFFFLTLNYNESVEIQRLFSPHHRTDGTVSLQLIHSTKFWSTRRDFNARTRDKLNLPHKYLLTKPLNKRRTF